MTTMTMATTTLTRTAILLILVMIMMKMMVMMITTMTTTPSPPLPTTTTAATPPSPSPPPPPPPHHHHQCSDLERPQELSSARTFLWQRSNKPCALPLIITKLRLLFYFYFFNWNERPQKGEMEEMKKTVDDEINKLSHTTTREFTPAARLDTLSCTGDMTGCESRGTNIFRRPMTQSFCFPPPLAIAFNASNAILCPL